MEGGRGCCHELRRPIRGSRGLEGGPDKFRGGVRSGIPAWGASWGIVRKAESRVFHQAESPGHWRVPPSSAAVLLSLSPIRLLSPVRSLSLLGLRLGWRGGRGGVAREGVRARVRVVRVRASCLLGRVLTGVVVGPGKAGDRRRGEATSDVTSGSQGRMPMVTWMGLGPGLVWAGGVGGVRESSHRGTRRLGPCSSKLVRCDSASLYS